MIEGGEYQMGLVFDTCRSLAGDGNRDELRAILEFPFVSVRGADDDDNKRSRSNTPITFNIP